MRSVQHCEYKRRNELRDYKPVTSLMVHSFIEMVLFIAHKLNRKGLLSWHKT